MSALSHATELPAIHFFDRCSASCHSARRAAAADDGMVGSKRLSTFQWRASVVDRVPEPDREAGKVRRAQRRRLGHFRPHDGDAEQVGLKLQQAIVGRCTAIDAQFRQVDCGVVPDGFEQVGDLERDGSRALPGRYGRLWCRASCRRSCRARTDPSAARPDRQTPARDRRRRCPARTTPVPPPRTIP